MAAQDPDILLSIGAGLDPNHNINPDDPGPKYSTGIGGFARRLMKLGFEIIRDNMDSEKKWKADVLPTQP